eukprot:m.26951 g.26951  ORF g.26951 m.26951 type:complete len:102 (+) comp29610_c0_seq1:341-646(+)
MQGTYICWEEANAVCMNKYAGNKPYKPTFLYLPSPSDIQLNAPAEPKWQKRSFTQSKRKTNLTCVKPPEPVFQSSERNIPVLECCIRVDTSSTYSGGLNVC